MSEKFCLKWNDFQQNISKSFKSLRCENNFYDVTLVGDDENLVSAHRVVLSSSSEYFKNILQVTKHGHPILCNEGVPGSDLNQILDYMYNGEVQIYQDQIDHFLNIAKRMKLEGLLENTSPKHEATHIQRTWTEATNFDSILPSKVEDNFKKQAMEPDTKVAKIQADNLSSTNEVDEKINQYILKHPDGSYGCELCGKKATKKQHLQNHIETHLEGISYSCNQCGKQFRSRNSVYVLKNRYNHI